MERRAWWTATAVLAVLLLVVPRLLGALPDPLFYLVSAIFLGEGLVYGLAAGGLAGWAWWRQTPAPTPTSEIARAAGLVAILGIAVTLVVVFVQGVPEQRFYGLVAQALLRVVLVAAAAALGWWGVQSLLLARRSTTTPA